MILNICCGRKIRFDLDLWDKYMKQIMPQCFLDFLNTANSICHKVIDFVHHFRVNVSGEPSSFTTWVKYFMSFFSGKRTKYFVFNSSLLPFTNASSSSPSLLALISFNFLLPRLADTLCVLGTLFFEYPIT